MSPLPPTQAEILRRLDGPARLCMALEMSDLAHALAVAGLRARHPEWSLADATAALARQGVEDGAARPRRAP